MTEANKIITNSFWHFLAKALGLVIGVVTIAFVTRYLGATGFGQYATALAWLQFSGILVDFGLYMILLSELGKAENKDAENKIIGNLLSLRALSAFVILILSLIIAWLTPYDIIIKLSITILAAAFWFQLINQILTGIFQNKLAMMKGSMIEFVGKGLGLIFIIFVIRHNWGLLAIVGSMTIANFLNTSLMWLLASRLNKLRFYFHFPYWRHLIKLAWPLAIGTIFNLFYFKADTLILSWFYPAAVVGLYAAPYRILEVLISLPPIFLGLTMPLLAKLWRQQQTKEFSHSVQKSFDFFHLFILPLLIATWLLAEPIMTLIAGQEFSAAAPILRLLIIATTFIYYTQLLSYIIVALEKQKQTLKYIILAALAALALYFIFIPRYSYLAAAVITVLVEGSIMLTFYFYVHKYLQPRLQWQSFRRTLLSALIMGVVILILKPLPLPLTIVGGGVAYILCLLLFGAVKFKEIKNILGL